mmetsp:Transcript_16153/g.16762  ORF Transcript_16153/g.16762 Transcript_16153/m.16762 type:complete len:309 (-) Transcript_16153:1263-2189(-)
MSDPAENTSNKKASGIKGKLKLIKRSETLIDIKKVDDSYKDTNKAEVHSLKNKLNLYNNNKNYNSQDFNSLLTPSHKKQISLHEGITPKAVIEETTLPQIPSTKNYTHTRKLSTPFNELNSSKSRLLTSESKDQKHSLDYSKKTFGNVSEKICSKCRQLEEEVDYLNKLINEKEEIISNQIIKLTNFKEEIDSLNKQAKVKEQDIITYQGRLSTITEENDRLKKESKDQVLVSDDDSSKMNERLYKRLESEKSEKYTKLKSENKKQENIIYQLNNQISDQKMIEDMLKTEVFKLKSALLEFKINMNYA